MPSIPAVKTQPIIVFLHPSRKTWPVEQAEHGKWQQRDLGFEGSEQVVCTYG